MFAGGRLRSLQHLTLNLRGVMTIDSLDFVAELPGSLTHLGLELRRSGLGAHQGALAGMARMPPRLVHLQLGFASTAASMSTLFAAVAGLPPALELLALNVAHNDITGEDLRQLRLPVGLAPTCQVMLQLVNTTSSEHDRLELAQRMENCCNLSMVV